VAQTRLPSNHANGQLHIAGLTFDPNGRELLINAGDGTVLVVDVAKLKPLGDGP